MNRLFLAVPAALAIHLLLLLTFVPQQKVIEPEIKGSGQITVSIIQPSRPVEESIEEVDLSAVEEVREEDAGLSAAEPVQEIEETSGVVQETLQERSKQPLITETLEEQEVPTVPVVQKEETSGPVAEEEIQPVRQTRQPARQTKNPQQQVFDDNTTAMSEQDALKDPEPLDHLNSPPKYPELARKRGWEGTVVLQVDIAGNGMVEDIQVKQSSTFALLDNAAMDAVRKWHFQPGSKGGKFIDMQVLVPVHFVLQEK